MSIANGKKTGTDYSELEKRIIRSAELGEEWAKLHEAWMQLDEAKKTVLADLQKDLDDGKTSEAKLERLARTRKEYKEFINNLCIAKGQELRAKVRYEAAQAFYEAGRTREATERERMKTLRDIP
jgi:hypothetical protein